MSGAEEDGHFRRLEGFVQLSAIFESALGLHSQARGGVRLLDGVYAQAVIPITHMGDSRYRLPALIAPSYSPKQRGLSQTKGFGGYAFHIPVNRRLPAIVLVSAFLFLVSMGAWLWYGAHRFQDCL